MAAAFCALAGLKGSMPANNTAVPRPWSSMIDGSPTTAAWSGIVLGQLTAMLVAITWLLGTAPVKATHRGAAAAVSLMCGAAWCLAAIAVKLNVQRHAADAKFCGTCCAAFGAVLGGLLFAANH
jgi:hypothetical protein